MTSFEAAPDAPSRALLDRIEIAGLRVLAVFFLASAVLDGAYLVVRFISFSYMLGDSHSWYLRADDLASSAWVLAEVGLGWLLATRAPGIARWLRARTRVDSVA
jgi:hypothetical protein